MTIRTYVGANEQEAVRQAVAELGKDALILNIQKVEPKGLWKMGVRQRVELQACASSDRAPVRRRPPPPLPPDAEPRERLSKAYGVGTRAASDLGGEVKAVNERMDRLMEMMKEQARAQRRTGIPDLSQSLQQAYAALLDREVAEPLARRLVNQVNEDLRGEELKNPLLVRGQLRQRVERMIRHSGPVGVPGDRPRIVALVGPTGVGKTTTIAKLATQARHVKRRKVGLITIDTYRMGAKEQLQQYADLLGIPLRVALTPGELRRAVQEMAQKDLVLIDTAGYSQKDLLKLSEVRTFLEAARPDETHLVLSCNSHPGTLRHALEIYKALHIDRILLTKLDEAVAFGCILDIATAAEHPFSYVTQGQEVTEDIALGEPARMARLVLGEDVP